MDMPSGLRAVADRERAMEDPAHGAVTPDGPGDRLHAVTGAFGYSGSYIARRLLDAGHRVMTLTNTRPGHDPFGGRVRAVPLDFRRLPELTASLRGVDVLYNTYWVRYEKRGFSHDIAVENSRRLFRAAQAAGVRRVVHLSITNPSEDSPLSYFRGKAEVEAALVQTGLSYAILRPTVLFGREDILINNIAWFLRRFPVFGLFGDGGYRLQPMYVEDLAELAVEQGAGNEDVVLDAIGPETFTYRDMVGMLGEAIGHRRPLVALPPWLVRGVGAIIGRVLGDVVTTKAEVRGLMDELLYVKSPPAGGTALSAWAREHASELGRTYASELARRQ